MELSHRQRQILQYIIQHSESHGYPPTVREIGQAVGLSSSSTVHAHLRALEQAGLIRRDAVLTRAIRVVAGNIEQLKLKQAGSRIVPSRVLSVAGNIEQLKLKQVINLPVLGRVAAGSPMLASQVIEDSFPVPKEFLGSGDGFILRVKGDSMVEDGIMNGDYVIVRRQDTAEDGETIVALVDDEATVKRFYRENGRIRLQPANSSMKPRWFDNVRIIGKVVGVLRKM